MTVSSAYRRLRELAEAFEAVAENHGDPVRADIANGEITVRAVFPTITRGEVIAEIGVQLGNQDPTLFTAAACRVDHPGLGMCRTADVLVMEREVYERGVHDDFAAFAPDVSVAFEVVSPPCASEDHLTKLRDYARMGIPMYVIVDPRDGMITVHSGTDTSAGEPRYADAPRRYKFGDTVQLGPWSVETGDFRRYRN
ncbi:Uma2 family endonuclease [Streptomyces sp. 135]|uniref:Uma2 family endonuclease n=1 Tax=Streptomyces sp. 135 TaxID=2838850 RepID=UPI001CBD3332|nr:Uma2 family endonuclease [Streptomyces sp. 135]